LRKIEVKDKKVFLNDREIEIMGVNRHEEHPEHGFAFPRDLMARDIALIEEMNCNFVRGSHYTNSQSFVDMLDERGLLFWSEIPIWGCGFSRETLGREKVVNRGLDMHREMLKYYYNHPSIVMWGMHNEILTDTSEGYEMSKKYYNYLKECGGNRLVVYASYLPETDISLEFTDIICLNLYYGWYNGELEYWQEALDKFTARQKSLGLDDKPVMMSEFGAAALYGCHDDESFLWTEEYQAKLIKHCLELFHAYPTMVGELIWHFADARTSKQAGISRARRFNNKGLLNEYRKPKLAYFAPQKCFEQFGAEKNK
jgi:beta-glucuronidase